MIPTYLWGIYVELIYHFIEKKKMQEYMNYSNYLKGIQANYSFFLLSKCFECQQVTSSAVYLNLTSTGYISHYPFAIFFNEFNEVKRIIPFI